jgi:threonine synthase
LQCQARTIACASTGNAATSLAGHAALAGLPAVIFVPDSAPEPKLAQLLIYGATVVAVQGSYQSAYRLCSAACERFGWYNRNCAINPVLVEGKKTGGLELAEQSALRGETLDWVAVSIGDGCTIAGIWKGIQEMHALGVLQRLPRMLGVQATAMAPLKDALEHDQLPPEIDGGTLADSINVPVPRNWRRAVHALRESHGRLVCVSEQQILAAMRLAGAQGVFAEPAAAASVAGIGQARADGVISQYENVVAMITGSGLKDTKNALAAGGEPLRLKPDLDALAQALERQGHPCTDWETIRKPEWE